MSGDFPLVLVSAWNDSGGGFTHRLFDGHSGICSWPFELQLGTAATPDLFQSRFKRKYFWPAFGDADAGAAFDAIEDDELKGTITGRHGKFAAYRPDVSLPEWRQKFVASAQGATDRGGLIRAYVESLFAAWRDRTASGRETLYLAHCPVVVLEADKIFTDFPAARIIHVYRNPLAGLGDFRLRHPAMPVADYAEKWMLVNVWAYAWAQKRPENVRLICLDDLLGARFSTMAALANWLGLPFEDVLLSPTWNGRPLAEMGPFGGVPRPGLDHEIESAARIFAQDQTELLAQTAAARHLLAPKKSWKPGSIS